MSDPRYTEVLQGLPATIPFVGPEAQERTRGAVFASRLGANESVFGPSPRAIEAMTKATAEAWMYGDPEAHDLRKALAAHHRIPADRILVGEGIDGLLGYLARMVISPGDTVVTSDGAYPTFAYHVAGYGAQIRKVPYAGDHEDPEALIAAARETDAKLVYLANPDNPMGSWHDATTIERMITALPEGTVLALDEAYADTAPPEAIPRMTLLHPRVVRFRTFSKAYGLAGLRVGYVIAPKAVLAAFSRIRNHFGVGRVALAGALAALEDQEHLAATVARIAASREEIGRIATRHGLTALPSATNFVAIDCGRDGHFARAVLASLIEQGIFVRMPFVSPQDRCIRVSCGTPEDLARLDAALPSALEAARRGPV